MAQPDPIPFTSLELERRWADIVDYARKAEQTANLLKTRELNKELKDAYKLILQDNKWQICIKIKDLWLWLVKEEAIKEKNAEASGNNPPAQ